MKITIHLTSLVVQYVSLALAQAPPPSLKEIENMLDFYEPGSESCYADHRGPVDMVFLVDRSSKKVIQEMPTIIQLADELAKMYKDSRFGLTFFSDFQCSDWYTRDECDKPILEGNIPTKHHTDPEGCYTYVSPLTSDLAKLKEKVKQGAITQLPSGRGEAGLAALMMIATDLRLGWPSTNDTFAQGERRHVIFVVTDDVSKNGSKTYGTKNPPKGDGTDKCATMNNPTEEFTSGKLKSRNVSLFMMIGKGGSKIDDPASVWRNLVKTLNVPFGYSDFDKGNAEALKSLKESLTYNAYYGGHVPCADPPAYNTLGL